MSVEQTPEDKQYARELISRIPPDILQDLRPFASLSLQTHIRTDVFGKRYTPQEIKVLEDTRRILQKKLVKKYRGYGGVGDYGFFEMAADYHLNNLSVLKELAQEDQDNPIK